VNLQPSSTIIAQPCAVDPVWWLCFYLVAVIVAPHPLVVGVGQNSLGWLAAKILRKFCEKLLSTFMRGSLAASAIRRAAAARR
jgi:hypothetical protein